MKTTIYSLPAIAKDSVDEFMKLHYMESKTLYSSDKLFTIEVTNFSNNKELFVGFLTGICRGLIISKHRL